jgi:hypothetical protein
MEKVHIVLITRGNTGIGYEVVKALFDSSGDYTILMGSRSLEKAKPPSRLFETSTNTGMRKFSPSSSTSKTTNPSKTLSPKSKTNTVASTH